MGTRLILPICAVIGIVLGIVAVIVSSQTPPTPPVPFAPPSSPYNHFIATVGVVEASSENLFIGTPFSEIVEKVFVEEGDFVKEGEPLFELNTLLLRTKLTEAKAGYAISLAKYKRQLDLPRAEEIPPMESKVQQAEAHFLDTLAQYELYEKISNPKAVSRDAYNQRKYSALEAKCALQEAEENLSLLMAGAWVADLEIFRAEKKQAMAAVKHIEEEIYRSTIRAPVSGVVLKLHARIGEFAAARETREPLLIFGRIEPLNIRIDIEEEEAWRLIKGAPAVAFVRGNSSISTELQYLRVIPYMVPKEALSGVGAEFVDTRVLQVMYEFEHGKLPIYPGQLMDVYLEAKPTRGSES
ncbi:MAG: hypothetical protein S4CHLAM45_12240 [Chlamydiales bacterium]|nr:hypothetical protein [Chlamydiales bacterium]MCH9619713.1 hypothetical protein [Chlamydiales bacterium]MCH9623319.1 hypothetical protein [Chlamydiales bacterium]